MIRITGEQFEDLKRRMNPEVFTEAQINNWVQDVSEKLQKSDLGSADSIEKAEADQFKEEFSSFIKVQVVRPPEKDDLSKGLKYETYFLREQQIEWENEIQKSEDGDEIIKARAGVYKDTALNGKLGRVGQRYGSKKAKEEGGEDKSSDDSNKISEETKKKFMNDLSFESITEKYEPEDEGEKLWDAQKKVLSKYLKKDPMDYVKTGGGGSTDSNMFNELKNDPKKFNKLVKELEKVTVPIVSEYKLSSDTSIKNNGSSIDLGDMHKFPSEAKHILNSMKVDKLASGNNIVRFTGFNGNDSYMKKQGGKATQDLKSADVFSDAEVAKLKQSLENIASKARGDNGKGFFKKSVSE